MRDINYYADKAKEKTGIKSDRKLSKEIGLSENSVTMYRTGRAYPSDESMVSLAKLAKEPAEQAILDLHILKNAGTSTEKVFKQIARSMAFLSLAFGLCLLSFFPNKADAKVSKVSDRQVINQTMYIM